MIIIFITEGKKMKNKNTIKAMIVVIIILLLGFWLNYARNNYSLIKSNNDKEKNNLIETLKEKQKEDKISGNIDSNKDEKESSELNSNNTKDKNNKFNDNNFEENEVDRSSDVRIIKPGEFPINHDVGINDKQNGNQTENQNADTLSKSGQNEKINTQVTQKPGQSQQAEQKDKTNQGKSEKPNIQKPEKPDNTQDPNKIKPDDSSVDDIIQQEDIIKEELGKMLTIFTENYRSVEEGLVFNSKNKNELPYEAFVGIKTTGENDGKLHKISWSGDNLDDIKANIKGKYRLKVSVNDTLRVAEKEYSDISFYVDVVIK